MIDMSIPVHARKARFWFGYFYGLARSGELQYLDNPPSLASARLKRAVLYALARRNGPMGLEARARIRIVNQLSKAFGVASAYPSLLKILQALYGDSAFIRSCYSRYAFVRAHPGRFPDHIPRLLSCSKSCSGLS